MSSSVLSSSLLFARRARRPAVALALLFLAGCAPQIGQESSAIVGGTATQDEPAVVLTVAHQSGSELATVCTGIVISPHVVLTAAHCVSPANVGANAIFNIYEGDNLAGATAATLLPVASVDFDSQYNAQDFSNGYDLGVVISPNALTPSPLTLNRASLTSSLVGQEATLIGYGETGPDMAQTAGIKREVDATLISYDSKFARFGMMGATACEGDSGGPALMSLDGVTKIAGIVSFGDPSCESAVTYTRVDAYLEWIDNEVESFDPGYFTDLSMPSKGGCDVAPRGSVWPWSALGFLALAFVVRRSRARARA